MRGLVWRVVGDASATDDVLQDAYLKAYRAQAQFSGSDDAFAGWLYRIVWNTALDHRRAKQRRTDAVIAAVVGQAATNASFVDEITTRAAVHDAIAQLSPQQAAAVTLVDLQDMTYAEAADVLDAPVGTVSTWVNRGRASLRLSLGMNQPGGRGEPTRRPS